MSRSTVLKPRPVRDPQGGYPRTHIEQSTAPDATQAADRTLHSGGSSLTLHAAESGPFTALGSTNPGPGPSSCGSAESKTPEQGFSSHCPAATPPKRYAPVFPKIEGAHMAVPQKEQKVTKDGTEVGALAAVRMNFAARFDFRGASFGAGHSRPRLDVRGITGLSGPPSRVRIPPENFSFGAGLTALEPLPSVLEAEKGGGR